MVKRQGGFTLIEIIFVLAISAMLVVIALAGQRQLRETAQLADAIDRIKNDLTQVRNEANTTVSVGGSGGQGTLPNNQFVFGKMALFVPGSSTYTVYTLVGDDTNAGTATLLLTSNSTFTIPYGVTFTGSTSSGPNSTKIIFVRDHNHGNLQTYTPPNAWTLATAQDPTQYVPWPSDTSLHGMVTLTYTHPNGNTGQVLIDGTSGQINKGIVQ